MREQVSDKGSRFELRLLETTPLLRAPPREMKVGKRRCGLCG